MLNNDNLLSESLIRMQQSRYNVVQIVANK